MSFTQSWIGPLMFGQPALLPSALRRDDRLDVLRGLLLVIMTVNHMGEPMFTYTFQTLGYFSSLEGFIFLSGMVAGIVYYRYVGSGWGSELWIRAARRAVTIFAYLVAGFLLLMALGYAAALATSIFLDYWAQGGWLGPLVYTPLEATLRLATFVYQPLYFHVLPLYIAFMSITPVVVSAVRRGFGWLVLVGSVSIWLAVQLGFELGLVAAIDPEKAVALGNLNALSWQLLFVLGVMIGCLHHAASGTSFNIISGKLLAVAAVVTVLLFTARHVNFYDDYQFSYWINITDLGAIRLLNFFAIAYLVACIANRYPAAFQVPWLALLGRQSIAVFTYHIVVVYALMPFSWRVDGIAKIALTALVVASLLVPAKFMERRRALRACGAAAADDSKA